VEGEPYSKSRALRAHLRISSFPQPRVPLVTNLRQDPWERYQDESMIYARWWGTLYCRLMHLLVNFIAPAMLIGTPGGKDADRRGIFGPWSGCSKAPSPWSSGSRLRSRTPCSGAWSRAVYIWLDWTRVLFCSALTTNALPNTVGQVNVVSDVLPTPAAGTLQFTLDLTPSPVLETPLEIASLAAGAGGGDHPRRG
jgi:hypothetical protein